MRGSALRHPKAGSSLWRLQVLSHRSCRVLTVLNGGGYPNISFVGELAFLWCASVRDRGGVRGWIGGVRRRDRGGERKLFCR